MNKTTDIFRTYRVRAANRQGHWHDVESHGDLDGAIKRAESFIADYGWRGEVVVVEMTERQAWSSKDVVALAPAGAKED